MINLVINDFKRDFLNKKNMFLLLIISIVSIFLAVFMNMGETSSIEEPNFNTSDWQAVTEDYQDELIEVNEKLLNSEDSSFIDKFNISLNQEEINRLEFHLDRDIPTDSSYNFYQTLNNIVNGVFIIAILTAYKSGSIISKEFNLKTIKEILVRPYKRTTILFSKYSNLLLHIIFYFLFFISSGAIASYFISNMNNSSYYVFANDTGIFSAVNFPKYISLKILYNLIFLIIIGTIGFTLSTFTQNTAISLSIVLILLFSGDSLVSYLSNKTKLVKLLPMAHWDLTQNLPGNNPLIENLELEFSIIYIVGFIILLLVLSGIYFNQKDIYE